MSLAKTLMSGVSILGLVTTIMLGSTAIAYIKQIEPTLPDHMQLSTWVPAEGTTIVARDGTIMGVHAKENRKFVPFKSIPNSIISAFIAAEDANYWRHHGVDVGAIARATLSNIKSPEGSRLEGGSTITQQVVKNILLSSERTMDRKIREGILALKIDRDIGKDRVLEIYLNQIYFGAGAYGVKVAAKTYFNKELTELSIEEAAMLAALPKSPTGVNPFSNPERALERRNYVLRRMLENKFISPFEYKVAVSKPVKVHKSINAVESDPAMWYPQEAVRRKVIEEQGSKYLYEDGGKVNSTIDIGIQKIVHTQLRHHLVNEDRKSGWRGPISKGKSGVLDWSSSDLLKPSGAEDWTVGVVQSADRDAVVLTNTGTVTLKGSGMTWATSKKRASAILSPGDVILLGDLGHGLELVQIPQIQGAVVVMDPRNGNVLSLDGGFSGEISEFDRASQAKRQTGSVFKPFVYMAAIEAGYNAMSPVLDSPIAIDQGKGKSYWRPNGGAAGGMGLITFRRSLEMSRNLSTVRLLYDLGMDKVVDVANRVGFTLPSRASYAMALGAAEATPLEVATAYSVFANGGYKVKPKLIASDIDDKNQVFNPMDVAKITSILEGVITSGTASKAFTGVEKPLAGKTGTTNQSRDVWFAAYGPEVVVVAWMGRDDHGPLYKGAAGGASIAPLVRSIVDNLEGEVVFSDFTIPMDAETIRVNRKTGSVDEKGDVLEVVTKEEFKQLEQSSAPIVENNTYENENYSEDDGYYYYDDNVE